MRTSLVKGISVVVVVVAAFALYRLRSHGAASGTVASAGADAESPIEVGLETMLDHHETYSGHLVVTKGMVMRVTPGEHGTTVVVAEGNRSAICYAAAGATFAEREWVRVRGRFEDYRIHDCVREDAR